MRPGAGGQSLGSGTTALLGVVIAVAGASGWHAVELGTQLDAVLAGGQRVADADVGQDFRARKAVRPLAQLVVRIDLLAFGDTAPARAVDGLLCVAPRVFVTLPAHGRG